MARKYFGFRPFNFVVCLTIFLGTFLYFKSNFSLFIEPEKTREQILKQINEFIKKGHKKIPNDVQACKIPTLDVNAPDIVKLLKTKPISICNSEKDWVEVDGSTAKISNWSLRTFGNVVCSFTDIIRDNDFKQYNGMTTTTHTEYNLEGSDVVKVYCEEGNGKTWKKVLLGVRSDQDILDRTGWNNVPEDSLRLNVLILGFDSLSHNMWKRKLPKTYKYAIENFEGIALNGYNIVGDGTPQALIPILTGKTELELPETRKRMKNAQYVNVYPFIWNEYQNNGYATMFSEDQPNIGTFTYRLKGFNEQPTDHYIKTFYMEASPSFNEKMHCYGQLSHMDVMINYVKDMYKIYKDKPKFIFSFSSEFTHDSLDYASTADEGTVKFLQEFHKKGFLNDTLLILMSDHGSRFADFRSSQQGKQEERLPGFIFVFPTWFKHKYPDAYANFKLNANRLTTPFDIHEVLKNVLHYEGAGVGNIENRGISLFKEVPTSRSCLDAFIEPHWCACLEWEDVPVSSSKVMKAATHLVDYINNISSDHRNLCAQLKLKTITRSAKLLPNNYLLTFKKSDPDGFLGYMSDNTYITTETYQITVLLSPGDMLFEASLRYVVKESEFVASEKDISRLDAYKRMSHCIEDRDILHDLRKYCYCIKQ